MHNDIDNIVSSKNYITPISYVQGRIIEYDIKSANISMLKKYNMISHNHYAYLSKLPKIDREKDIGRIIRSNKEIYNTISKGIDKSIKDFISYNNIDIKNIIRRANDALYINTPVDLKHTKIDDIIIRPKNIYSSFLNINKILFFFYYNPDINVDVKGISKDMIELHNGYIISVIGTTILLLERSSISDALEYLNSIIESYITRKLELGYYREFNNLSGYRYSINNQSYILYNVNSLENVDISYNLNILRELYSVIFNLYLNNNT